MATVKLTKGWRISSDAHSWRVQRFEGMRERKNRKTGNVEVFEHWETMTHHSTLQDAFTSYVELRLRLTEDIESARQLGTAIRNLRAELREVCLAILEPINSDASRAMMKLIAPEEPDEPDEVEEVEAGDS